jgi:hypothetical protein
MQVVQSSNDQDHADGNVERHSIDASEKAAGDDSNVLCLNASCASNGVAPNSDSLSRVACQGTGVVNVHKADMCIIIWYRLSTPTSRLVLHSVPMDTCLCCCTEEHCAPWL